MISDTSVSMLEMKPQTEYGESSSFSMYLQQILVDRKKTRSNYSLRSFAQSLGMDPSLLSKILSGKRSVSSKLYRKLTEKLSLSPSQVRGFAREMGEKRIYSFSNVSSLVKDYQQVTADQFHLISDWYHYALYELVRVKGFKSNVAWIAKALGISRIEAKVALQRLERLGLIKKNKKSDWKQLSGSITNIKTEFTASALRKLQKQILSMAITALEEVPIQYRDQTSMTMAVDEKLLPEAKRRIAAFRRELSDFLQKSGQMNRVYHLSVSLYPAMKINKGDRE